MYNAIILASTLFSAGSAFASNIEPVLVKTSFSGFVAPMWVREETCELYRDGLIVSRSYGADVSAKTKEARPVILSGKVDELIQKASMEQLVAKQNNVCDGPSTKTYAVLKGANGEKTEVVLFRTGGCGSHRLERNEGASKILRDIIDSYCPQTHD